jgi:hypothetical protein
MLDYWIGISGERLLGKSVTRFVYLDEAGISQREPFAVVSGVIVHADKQLNELERRLNGLCQKHIPVDQQADFVFHAKELFNGGGKVFCRKSSEWPLSRRLEIAHDIASIPVKMGLPIALGFVQKAIWPIDKAAFPSNLSSAEESVEQHVTAYMSCMIQIELWMRNNTSNEVTMLVAEDNNQARSRIKEAHNFHRNDEKFRRLPINHELRRYFPLKKIKNSPLFEAKSDCPALQISDFCAYVFKKRLENDHRYSQISNLLQPHYAVHQLPSDERPVLRKPR